MYVLFTTGLAGNQNQRTSWSPQGSVPQSPLTEQESYADKLRALEEVIFIFDL
jgi:hypothetical protein